MVHPMRAQYLCTTSQAKKVTVLVWLLACLLALPTAVARVHLPVQDGSKFYCILDWDRPWLFQSHQIYLLVTVLLVPGTMMVVSYISIICQLHRINIERRSLSINTAIPLAYKYHSSKVEKYPGPAVSPSTDLTSRQTGQTVTETSEFITTSPDSIKITDTQIVEEFDDGKPRKCWSILSYRDKNSRSQSVIIKQTKHKQRRLSDFIGLSKVTNYHLTI